jgi:hypothetical protein
MCVESKFVLLRRIITNKHEQHEKDRKEISENETLAKVPWCSRLSTTHSQALYGTKRARSNKARIKRNKPIPAWIYKRRYSSLEVNWENFFFQQQWQSRQPGVDLLWWWLSLLFFLLLFLFCFLSLLLLLLLLLLFYFSNTNLRERVRKKK